MINPATALCMLRDIEKLKKGDVVVQNAANCTCIQVVTPRRRLLIPQHLPRCSCGGPSSRADCRPQARRRDDQLRAGPVRSPLSLALCFFPCAHACAKLSQQGPRLAARRLCTVGRGRTRHARLYVRGAGRSQQRGQGGHQEASQRPQDQAGPQCAVRQGHAQHGQAARVSCAALPPGPAQTRLTSPPLVPPSDPRQAW